MVKSWVRSWGAKVAESWYDGSWHLRETSCDTQHLIATQAVGSQGERIDGKLDLEYVRSDDV